MSDAHEVLAGWDLPTLHRQLDDGRQLVVNRSYSAKAGFASATRRP